MVEICSWLAYQKKRSEVGTCLGAVEPYPSLRRFETTHADELRAKAMGRSYARLEFFDMVYLAKMDRLRLTEIHSNDRAVDKVKGIKRIFE